MKAKTLMMLALCLTTTVAKAQVVYGDDEKNYARTTCSSMPMSATNRNLQQQPSILMEHTFPSIRYRRQLVCLCASWYIHFSWCAKGMRRLL